ncbi:MAG: trehalose-6-phosphate synthase, partial [Candidatus Zixiibacteriota bacterium]
MTPVDKRLVVVSNRLPVDVRHTEEEGWSVHPAPGGLVTALAPIMRQNHGLWIGWPGCGPEAPLEDLLTELSAKQNYNLKALPLTAEEVEKYYRGHANRTIWPLFHDLLGYFSFNYDNWHTYCEVNRRFARAIVEAGTTNSFIWVHDYQLLMVGKFLREMGVRDYLSFFLHIPFPSLDLFRRLPSKEELLEAMLQYDHIGFQTPNDRRNFIHCLKWLVPEARRMVNKRETILQYEGRDIKVGHYPISID